MSMCPWCRTAVRPTADYCAQCGQRQTLGEVPPLPAGTALQRGRYHLDQRLGVGGTGDVYLAQDRRLFNRLVVIKRLRTIPAAPQARAQVERNFELEAQALASLQHPQIPQILDFFTDPPFLYLVMAYAPGTTLPAYLAQHGGRLAARQVGAIAAQVTAILVYLHAQTPPIIHRDIKPANLIMDPAGMVTLVDFGVARAQSAAWALAAPTGSSAAWGTPGYAPPEQLAGRAGPPADIYALGATLRELLTGAAPIDPIQGFTLPPLTAPTLSLGAVLIPLITQMMDPDPAGRPTAAALLRHFQIGPPPPLPLDRPAVPPSEDRPTTPFDPSAGPVFDQPTPPAGYTSASNYRTVVTEAGPQRPGLVGILGPLTLLGWALPILLGAFATLLLIHTVRAATGAPAAFCTVLSLREGVFPLLVSGLAAAILLWGAHPFLPPVFRARLATLRSAILLSLALTGSILLLPALLNVLGIAIATCS